MTRFDATDRPLWTLVGAAYVQLLAPLREYVATLRQIGVRPRRADLEIQGFSLTRTMPAIAVYAGPGRAEESTSQSLDWKIVVEIHCFCDALSPGEELPQDQPDGTRALTQHVVEHLHRRLLPADHESGILDGEGIEVQEVEPVTTTERVDWWVVRTDVLVRHEIRRQRSEPVESIEFQQFGQRAGQPQNDTPLAVTILDFATASAQTKEESHS